MKKTAKQILSLLLCTCLLMSCVGFGSAFAEEGEHVHEWISDGTKPVWSDDNSTCTRSLVCALDSSHTTTQTVDATYSVTTEPTCTEKGSATYKAVFTNPALQFTKPVTLPTIPHTFDESIEENVTIVEPTCTTAGSKVVKCAFCDATQTTDVPALGHRYSTEWSYDEALGGRAPSCLESGKHVRKCDFCDFIDTIEDAAIGHSFDESVEENVTIVEPTCTAAGSKTVKCARCDQTQVTPIAALGHNYYGEVTTAATCEAEGTITYTCQREGCDDSYTETLAALGHSFDETIAENVTVVDATCTAAGSKTVKCARCDQTQVTPIAALGHSFDETVEGKVAIVDPTCTAAGSKTVTCVRCEQTQVTPIAALGHDFDESIEGKVAIVDPTCTAAGSKTVTCARCDQTRVTAIDAIGHSYDAEVTTAATCEGEGTITYSCSRKGCSDSYTETLAALGHNFDDQIKANVQIDPATCTAAGTKTVKCERCDQTRSMELTALGHQLEMVEGSDAGNMALYRCTRENCNYEEYRGKTNSDTHIYPSQNPQFIKKSQLFDEYTSQTPYYGNLVRGFDDIIRKDMNPKSTEEQYQGYLDAIAGGTLDTWEYEDGGCGIACTNKTEGIPHADVEMNAHVWNAGEISVQPTCTEKGVQTFTCANCAQTVTVAIPALGHAYGEGVVTAPTCVEKGYTTYTCTRPGCTAETEGHSYTDGEIAETGHELGEPSFNDDAAFFKDGTQTRRCIHEGCTYSETETAPGTNKCDVFFDKMIAFFGGTDIFLISIPINAMRWFVKLFYFGK